jgi:hypothetical protein
MREKPTNTTIIHSVRLLCMVAPIATHQVTSHNTPIHNILSTAPQLNSFQKALETQPEDGSLMRNHVGATIHN